MAAKKAAAARKGAKRTGSEASRVRVRSTSGSTGRKKIQTSRKDGVGVASKRTGAKARRAASGKTVARSIKGTRKSVPTAKPEKKKAAGVKPAARKAAKKPAKTIAAKKTAPIVSRPAGDERHPLKPEAALPTASVASVEVPITLPAVWPFPLGNRS